MSDKKESMVIFITHGAEDQERVILPYVVANAALAMDVEVSIVLQGTGVTTAKKGIYEHIFVPGLDPLETHMKNFFEFGGAMYVCVPCLEERKITADMLIEQAKLVKAGVVVQACLEADAILNY